MWKLKIAYREGQKGFAPLLAFRHVYQLAANELTVWR